MAWPPYSDSVLRFMEGCCFGGIGYGGQSSCWPHCRPRDFIREQVFELGLEEGLGVSQEDEQRSLGSGGQVTWGLAVGRSLAFPRETKVSGELAKKKARLLIVKSMSQLVKNLSTMRETICNTGDAGSIPGLGRSPGEGNGTPPEYSCLENPMGRGAGQIAVQGVARVGRDLATKPPPLGKGSSGRSHILSAFLYLCISTETS